jgi:hypothetical protein
MKHATIRPWLLWCTFAVTMACTLPIILFPYGRQVRRDVREHPLKAPIKIVNVRGAVLMSACRNYRIAGVKMPSNPARAARAHSLLQVITAQGVEVVRQVSPATSGYLLRCEPRFWNWCGTSDVAAWFKQLPLNELLISLGAAEFDRSAVGLTDEERIRLEDADWVGKHYHHWGSDAAQASDGRLPDFLPGIGLNIDALMLYETGLSAAQTVRWQKNRAQAQPE